MLSSLTVGIFISLHFDNYIKGKLILVNNTDSTLAIIANIDKFDNIIDNTMFKIESNDSIDAFEFNIHNSNAHLSSTDLKKFLKVDLIIKNYKSQFMSFPINIDAWNCNIFKIKKYLYFNIIYSNYYFNITDSTFNNPRYKIEYSDSTIKAFL